MELIKTAEPVGDYLNQEAIKMEYTTANLEQLYLEYYSRVDIDVPDIQRRELAFIYWNDKEGIRDRPCYFETNEELNKFLRRVPRASVYHSTAYYLDPNERTMPKKGWQKCDLIFDIDGDCPEGKYMDMLGRLGKHTKTLIDEFLVEDFGIPLEDIRIEFSGKKGFHLTVLSDEWKTLSKEGRRQLIDYIEGCKVDKTVLFPEKKGYIMCNPNAKGWRKYARRTVESLLELSEDLTAEEIEPILSEWGFPKVRTKKISDLLTQPKIRQAVLEGRLSPLTSKGERTLTDLMRMVVKQHNLGLGGCIDRKVTFDTNRIIRAPGTLHCKSGFPCITITYEDLTNPVSIFDKIRETVGTDEITVKIAQATSIETDTGIIELEVGVHTLPRWIGIALLSKISYN